MLSDGRQTPSSTDSRCDAAEQEHERRKLRRLQILVGMIQSVLSQDAELTAERASALIASCRQAALAMFPGKELAPSRRPESSFSTCFTPSTAPGAVRPPPATDAAS